MSTFVKAKLLAQGGGNNIEFMFNPAELSFSRGLRLNTPSGPRTEEGLPKVSFGSPNPYSVNVSGLVFDTYETGENVIDKYVENFRQAVEFIEGKERPPIYLLTWGKQEYLRCFIESLSYKLTMFLTDGTPVRATVDITLKEVGEVSGAGSAQTPNRPSSGT